MLDEKIIALLKDNQFPSIEKNMLTQEQLELIYTQKWFGIWVPRELRGLELDLEAGCRLLGELAYIDGGFSWTVTLCAGANMFAGFINDSFGRKIFADPKVCFGGSGKIAGTAEKVKGGYLVSGIWPYATGAPHLTHFTANCPVEEANLGYRSFFFDKDDVLIHYDWETFGLEATASHSFSVSGLFVPEERAFDLLPEKATQASPLFQIPFMPFAEATLYVNYAGMFRRFCDLAFRHYTQKSFDREWLAQYGTAYFDKLNEVRQRIAEGHGRIYELIKELWQQAVEGNGESGDTVNKELALLTRKQVSLMKENMIEIYTTCGIAAAQKGNEMNIVFRNFFTATQHALLNRKA